MTNKAHTARRRGSKCDVHFVQQERLLRRLPVNKEGLPCFMGFAPGRGVRRQEYSVTKKKGSRPWNLKKWQLGCFIPPCEIDNGKFTRICLHWLSCLPRAARVALRAACGRVDARPENEHPCGAQAGAVSISNGTAVSGSPRGHPRRWSAGQVRRGSEAG
jgi:hypothetical protein